MEVVSRVDGLRPELGPSFVVVGVFDGLHLGHHYLLRHLVAEAVARRARPTVITFDHHPDEVLTGHAPPLLLDPAERLERLAEAGVAVTVVQPFDAALRRTTYDAFVERIRRRVELRGFLMTPDAAFGYERRGTPETLTALGRRDGFDVVVVQPFTLDGRLVRSSEIRAAIAAGDLDGAAALLGRPVTLTGAVKRDGPIGRRLDFDMPIALPPDGAYAGHMDGAPVTLRLAAGLAYVEGRGPGAKRVTVELSGAVARAALPPTAGGSRSEP
jgi:riboflavin kinase/FMN adenylyltransferase